MAGYKIEIEHLSKKYGDNVVLKDINLTIAPGEFIALVGKSGCGKSTLLRIVSALTAPSCSTVRINGAESREIDPEVRFLFQDARLLPWKTVLQNVVLGSPARDEAKAKEVLMTVGLAGKETAWPSDLSGGQQQRVAIARALIGTPKVLLLDEPFSALDALTRIQMQRLVETLWQHYRFTVILVTHDVPEAVYLADRIILIGDGSIQLNQTVQLARPLDRNGDFAYYESLVLNHILKPQVQPVAENYSI